MAEHRGRNGFLGLVEGRAVVVDAGPSGDDLLDDVLRVLAEDATRSRSLKRQLKVVRRARAAMKDDPVAGAVKAIVDEVYAVTAGAAVAVFGV